MVEILSYDFMQRALLSSVLIGTLCAIVGVFVVLKGISFIGAGTAHAAFAGVAFAYLIGGNPLLFALLFGLLTVWTTNYLQQIDGLKADVTIGIFYALTMALAILFIGLMKTYNAEVYGYLFGNILSVSNQDLLIIGFLSMVILLIIFLFFKEFHFIAFDQEMAEASGIPTKKLYGLLLNLIVITIVISLKSVGSLLVFALILIPAAAAYQLTHRMKYMMAYAVGIGISSSVGGVLFSYWMDLPSGSAIVILAVIFFIVCIIFSPKRGRRKVLPKI